MDFKGQLIKLYKSAFDDSDNYVNYFFGRRYKPEYIVAADGDGRIVTADAAAENGARRIASALHLFPRKIFIEGAVRDCGFITAAATLPGFRGKGLMGRVLSKAFGRLEERGVRYCVLYPRITGFYEKYGFFTYAPAPPEVNPGEIEMIFNTPPHSAEIIGKAETEKNLPRVMELYQKYTDGYEGWTVRDADAFREKIDESRADGGIVYMVKTNDKYSGYILAGECETDECCLLKTEGAAFPLENVSGAAGGNAPGAMMKILGAGAEEEKRRILSRPAVMLDKY